MIDGAGSRGARPFLFIPSTGRRSQGAGTAIPGAMEAYARQAKDTQLLNHATEIKLRAERRLGELIIAQKEGIGLNQGTAGILHGRIPLGATIFEGPKDTERPTLAEVGIDYKLSSRAQKIASVPEAKFEAILADMKEKQEAGRTYRRAEGKRRASEWGRAWRESANRWY